MRKTSRQRLLTDESYVIWRISNDLNPCNPEKTVLNFNSTINSYRLRTFLAFGLDFCLPIYKINYHKYFLKFDRFLHNVMNNKNAHCTNPSEFQSNLRTLAYKVFYNFKPFKVWSDIFKSSDIKLLKKLAAYKDVVVCKPKKGKGVVIVDRSDYIHSLENIISDESKFKQIDEPTQSYCDKVEGSINNFLISQKSKFIIDDATYKQLYVTGYTSYLKFTKLTLHQSLQTSKIYCSNFCSIY